jgi:hypothetical protein
MALYVALVYLAPGNLLAWGESKSEGLLFRKRLWRDRRWQRQTTGRQPQRR